jgi:hypothetical protein
MGWKRKVGGGFLAAIGYMLSPLSWWNDLFVNVPLAVAFGWVISLVYQPAFSPAVVVGYWLTNVAGFILMQKGAQQMFKDEKKPYRARDLGKDVAVSLLYTLLIVALIELGVLKPIQSYFPHQ